MLDAHGADSLRQLLAPVAAETLLDVAQLVTRPRVLAAEYLGGPVHHGAFIFAHGGSPVFVQMGLVKADGWLKRNGATFPDCSWQRCLRNGAFESRPAVAGRLGSSASRSSLRRPRAEGPPRRRASLKSVKRVRGAQGRAGVGPRAMPPLILRARVYVNVKSPRPSESRSDSSSSRAISRRASSPGPRSGARTRPPL